MHKKILSILLILCCLLTPSAAFADTSNSANAAKDSMAEYIVGNDNMHISLPDDWYINTPESIDQDFLQVTENTEKKLKKYLSKHGIQYNLVSKDLKEELNIILQHTSQTKAMFDFNLLDENVLKDRAQTLIDLGTQEEDGISTTYTAYTVEKINKCVFTIFHGTIESDDGRTNFIQYTTTINGYGVTISYRADASVKIENKTAFVRNIVNSFDVTEVIETELKTEVYKQMMVPIALAGGFILITVILFIRQLRKNRKSKSETL